MSQTMTQESFKVVKLRQGDPAWFEWRTKHVTGSEIGAIAGVEGAFSSIFEVWLRKKGLLSESMENPAMTRGKNYEDLLRRRFEELRGRAYLPECVESVTEPWVASSLDALEVDTQESFGEFKIPGEHTHLVAKHYGAEGLKDFVAQYYAQVQWQHLSLGNDKRGFFSTAFGFPEEIPFYKIWPYAEFREKTDISLSEIPVDEAYQNRLLEAGWAFFKLLKRTVLPEQELARIVRNFQASGPDPFDGESPENTAILLGNIMATVSLLNKRAKTLRGKLVEHVASLGVESAHIGGLNFEPTAPKRSWHGELIRAKLGRGPEESLEDLKVPGKAGGWRVSRGDEDEE